MHLASGQRLVFIGDSITDCGRGRPFGEGNQLGHGYVALFQALLGARYPDLRIRVTNTGTDGHTVLDLQARWQQDVLALQPDWVILMIGTNDVWRQFDAPLQVETHVPLAQFEATLDELMATTLSRGIRLVAMTPFFLEPNRSDPMRAAMDRYGDTVRQLAQRHQALFVDTQARMDRLLAHQHPMALCWDRVHPSLTGHMALAEACLAALTG